MSVNNAFSYAGEAQDETDFTIQRMLNEEEPQTSDERTNGEPTQKKIQFENINESYDNYDVVGMEVESDRSATPGEDPPSKKKVYARCKTTESKAARDIERHPVLPGCKPKVGKKGCKSRCSEVLTEEWRIEINKIY